MLHKSAPTLPFRPLPLPRIVGFVEHVSDVLGPGSGNNSSTSETCSTNQSHGAPNGIDFVGRSLHKIVRRTQFIKLGFFNKIRKLHQTSLNPPSSILLADKISVLRLPFVGALIGLVKSNDQMHPDETL